MQPLVADECDADIQRKKDIGVPVGTKERITLPAVSVTNREAIDNCGANRQPKGQTLSEGKIDVRGGKVWYRTWGEGGATPLLVLQRWSGDAERLPP